jgi:EAL and modified HD-GYP domain-containing signal transduction protein
MSEMMLTPYTLHPLVDPQHRWRALAVVGDKCDAATLTHWIGTLGLRETLGSLALLLPPLAPAAVSEPLLAALPPGQTLLPLPRGATDADDVARLVERGVIVLHALGDENPPAAGHGVWGRAEPITPAGTAIPRILLGIDHPEQVKQAAAAGWQWLGGHYALHPADPSPVPQGASRGIVMRLLGQVAADEDHDAIERTLKQDTQISYQLLRLVNSAAFALPRQISSFNQAITLLGRRQLQRWLQLLLYAQRNEGAASPLLPRAAWRAGLMESLTRRAGGDREAQDAAFMTGMFSLLEVLIGQPMSEIIAPLNLTPAVADALVTHGGALGARLALVAAADRTAPEADALDNAAVTAEDWLAAQVEAARWAIAVSQEA